LSKKLSEKGLYGRSRTTRPPPRKAPVRPWHNAPVLLLLALEAGNEHLLSSLQVVLEPGTEELPELLVAFCLGILDVSLERLYVS
jgi:hypothetical protein